MNYTISKNDPTDATGNFRPRDAHSCMAINSGLYTFSETEYCCLSVEKKQFLLMYVLPVYVVFRIKMSGSCARNEKQLCRHCVRRDTWKRLSMFFEYIQREVLFAHLWLLIILLLTRLAALSG